MEAPFLLLVNFTFRACVLQLEEEKKLLYFFVALKEKVATLSYFLCKSGLTKSSAEIKSLNLYLYGASLFKGGLREKKALKLISSLTTSFISLKVRHHHFKEVKKKEVNNNNKIIAAI